MGLQVLQSGFAVLQPGGEGSSLVMESFHASRDVLVCRVHLCARIGDRDDFKEKLNGLWREVPELDKDYPLDETRMSTILSSFRKAIKDFHPSAFESRAKKLHPEGRLPRARGQAAARNNA